MNMTEWVKKDTLFQSFFNEEMELVIHVIKTGFPNKYMVVYEDPNLLINGITEIYTSEELENNFKIKI